MDQATAYILTQIGKVREDLRDLSETLRRIEAGLARPQRAVQWQRLLPSMAWAAALLGLLAAQYPLPKAVEILTRLHALF